MTDRFAAFGLVPSPFLDADFLKAEFQRLGGEAHPDRGGDAENFRALNEAYRVLRDPARRLRHLLELRAPELLARQREPDGPVAELFLRAGEAMQRAAALQRRAAAADSPLAQALLSGDKMTLADELAALRGEAERGHAAALEEVAGLGSGWTTDPGLRTLAELQLRLTFYGKWTRELGEAALKLEF